MSREILTIALNDGCAKLRARKATYCVTPACLDTNETIHFLNGNKQSFFLYKKRVKYRDPGNAVSKNPEKSGYSASKHQLFIILRLVKKWISF